MQHGTVISQARKTSPAAEADEAPPSRIGTLIRKSWKWLLVAILISVVFYKVKLAPLPVIAHSVAATTVVAEVMGTGTLEARVKTTISARIQERLAEVLADQNDHVTAGQLLARLDDGELKQQVEVAAANLAAAQASLERVKIDQDRADAVAKQAILTHQRASELMATKVASQDELDKAVESMHVAEADARRAQAAIVEAESQVLAAEKNLAYQQERLTFTRIVSPYDGLIVRRDRDAGGVVVPGSSIMQLISTNEIWVSAWVDETALARLAPGKPARVVFRSEPDAAYEGEVARIGRETDRETREFLVDVRVKSLPAQWAAGQRAEVFIEAGRKESALAVPLQFLSWKGGKPGVFVNDGGRARWREIQLGLRGLDVAEVTKGLAAGEVVCRSQPLSKQRLSDGRRIRAQ